MIRFVTGSCKRFAPFALALLITAGAQAATVSATFTLTASAPLSGTTYTFTGQATMSGVYTGNGAFSSTVSFTSSTPAPFTITVTAGNTLTGTFGLDPAALGGTGTGSLTITGGTGTYAGYTGTFSSVKETGSISTATLSFSLSCNGTGTVNTSGGGTTTPVPTVASVQDAASNTHNIAQGSVFSVYGTNLSPSIQGLTSFPWPKVSNGVKVTFTPATGGAGTDAYLTYIGTSQINAMLPSTVPVGNYNVTVTNGTASAPFLAQVVASKVGLFTQDYSGTGLAVVDNYISQSQNDRNRLTTGSFNSVTISPAKPGQTLIAWGTGLGAWAAADTALGVVHDFSASQTIAAIVGGVSIPVVFAGRTAPGLDQINFTLPSNVPTGCSVTLQISVAGVLSAVTSIAIAPAGATACIQPGYTTQQLVTLDQGGTITTGGFSLSQSMETDPSYGSFTSAGAAGVFAQITGYQLSSSSGSQGVILANSGGCIVTRVTNTGSTVSAGHGTSLDAGTVTLTGPAGSNLNAQKLTETSNAYTYSFGNPLTGVGGSLMQGTYTLNGAGGNDVGPFNTSITLGPLFTLNSPLPATVTESAGLTLNWTGGNASDVVEITGDSEITSGAGANKTTTVTGFVCTTTAGQKTFTVPASILTLLPTFTAAQVAAETAAGSLGVTTITTPSTSFNATLKKDNSNIPSAFGAIISIGGQALYQ